MTSKLEFVEMGFDSIDHSILSKLLRHKEHMKQNYNPINLKDCKRYDLVHMSQAYQESYPFWSCPHSCTNSKVEDFKIGARVLNINSTLANFVPFGLRGTVVGKTDHHLVVLFDEQFLGGGRDVLKRFKYQSAKVYPQHVINLTWQFTMIAQQPQFFKEVSKFMEKPIAGCDEYASGDLEIATGESKR